MNLSVIVLCANNQIDYMLNSLLPQLNESDEIIIVDDNSDFEVVNKISEVLKTYNHIIIKSKKNGNRGHNRNLGASFAKNDFLLFIDGDIILLDNVIAIIKQKLLENSQQCILGRISNLMLDNNQCSLVHGVSNYLDLLKNRDSLLAQINHERNKDSRFQTANQMIMQNYAWLLFWTVYCVIPKKIYDKIGGFDESYIEWGAEDSDIGYRLSKETKINFYFDLQAIHIPHYRNTYNNDVTNNANLYKLLGKFKDISIETHIGYSKIDKSLKLILNIKEYLKNNINFSMKDAVLDNDTLYVDHISKQYPNGHIYFKTEGSEVENLTLIGMHLPIYDKTFKKAILTENIFIYPESIYCKIINEALRIAKYVYLKKECEPIRIQWDYMHPSISILNSANRKSNKFFQPNRITYFDFINESQNFYQVKHKECANKIKRFHYNIFNRLDQIIEVNKNIHKIIKLTKNAEKYLFVNISTSHMDDCPIEALSFLLKIEFYLHYNSYINNSEVRLSQLDENIHDHNINIIFYLDSQDAINQEERVLWKNNRGNYFDLIISKDGKIIPI